MEGKDSTPFLIRVGFLQVLRLINIPIEISSYHMDDPRLAYGLFRENKIDNLTVNESYDIANGALIAKTAVIGKNVQIMPFAYMGGEVTIGGNVYVGVGTRLVGKVDIGHNVLIR